ncbi:unnamed protein product [Triticum turgidum subsp. durum]|uniref:Uncharacterized protein n=1 Tax=Triticum turgidum subsp. durum TaxID=4567 RepID=A0A9R1B5I7_TRITD|nr:unnamed protein product [Triticum turgidum subsp. durum]
MSDDEDVWPRQLRQMVGLRLVGARPGGVRLVGVRHRLRPSCLVGLGSVGVFVVSVAWVALGLDFSAAGYFIGVCKGVHLAGVMVWGYRCQCKN